MRRSQIKTAAVVVAVGIIALLPLAALAIAQPDNIRVLNVHAFRSVLESGDALVVAKYRLEYTTLPAEDINDAYIGRFIDTQTNTELANTKPYPFVKQGYDDGIFSMYWTAAEFTGDGLTWDALATGRYTVKLQGLPTVFVSPPSKENNSIIRHDVFDTEAELTTRMGIVAVELEGAWTGDDPAKAVLLSTEAPGLVFSDNGEEYFSNSIPNLRTMAPRLFAASLTDVFFEEREFTKSYSDSLQGFWDGTPIGDGFQSMADFFNMPVLMMKSLLFMMLMGGAAMLSSMAARNASYGVLSLAITLPMSIVIGGPSLTFGAIMAMFAVLIIGYSLFYARST